MSNVMDRYGVSAWLDNIGLPKLADAVMDEKRFPPVRPEIIYCKDCRYYNDHTEECDNDKGLRFLDYSNLDLMYCAWAERREDD